MHHHLDRSVLTLNGRKPGTLALHGGDSPPEEQVLPEMPSTALLGNIHGHRAT